MTAAADEGLIDIHDRRPLVLTPDAALAWLSQETSGKDAEDIAKNGAIPAGEFTWHPVTRSVGNIKNQGAELIEPLA